MFSEQSENTLLDSRCRISDFGASDIMIPEKERLTSLSSDDELLADGMRSKSTNSYDDGDDDDDERDFALTKRQDEFVGDTDSPPSKSNLRRKKHSFARMVDLKIDLDLAAYRNGSKSKDHSVPDIQVFDDRIETESPEGRGSRFNLLGRCRSGSETSDTLKRMTKGECEKEGSNHTIDLDTGRHRILDKDFKHGNRSRRSSSEKDLRQVSKHGSDKDLRQVRTRSEKDLRSVKGRHGSDKDLRQVERELKNENMPAGPSLLSAPTNYNCSRRASDTNIKYIKSSPAGFRKETKKARLRLDSHKTMDKSMDGSWDVFADEEHDIVSPVTSIPSSPALSVLRKARVSLPFIKFSEVEPNPGDPGESEKAGTLTPTLKSRTRRQTFAHTTNMRLRVVAHTSGHDRFRDSDEDIAHMRSTGDLDSIGETTVQEYNLDFDLAAMRKKSCFVLTNRPTHDTDAPDDGTPVVQPDNLTECTNLVRAIEFAAFEINELHQKQQKNRRASCPAKSSDSGEDGKSPKRWRKKTSILGWISPSSSSSAAEEADGAADKNIIDLGNISDMKKVVDDFKDSDIIISNIDRLVGRRGGVAEKCSIERQLVKHAVKHLMKNAILAQAI